MTYTADQFEEEIHAALRAGDIQAIDPLLRALVAVDPAVLPLARAQWAQEHAAETELLAINERLYNERNELRVRLKNLIDAYQRPPLSWPYNDERAAAIIAAPSRGEVQT